MPISATRRKILSSAGANRRPIASPLPVLILAAYSKKLTQEVTRASDLIEKRLFPALPGIESFQRVDSISTDADRINEILNGILNMFYGGMLAKGTPNINGYVRRAAAKIVSPMQDDLNRFNQTQFKQQFKRISGVDPLQFEPGLSDALELAGDINVDKIVTLSSDYFAQIKELANQALRQGKSVQDLTDQIKTLTGTTKTRAHLIAIDQVQKLNSDLEQTRQQANGITRYIWRTRRNARVRSKSNSNGYSDHAGLEGAVFDYRFPPVTVLKGKRAGETNNPGHDINCKCYGEPVIEDLTGKSSKVLEEGESKTRALISAGRVPGYTIPKRKTETEAA